MSLFKIRAGTNGEYEKDFIEMKRIFLQWEEIENVDFINFSNIENTRETLFEKIKDPNKIKVSQKTHQIITFVYKMQVGDIVILPYKNIP